jgi:two-component system, OmpR family, response regulator
MYPHTLALIDDDLEYPEYLAEHLRGLGIKVHLFRSGAELLTDEVAFHCDFYVVDLAMPGVDGLELIKILRRRTQAGVLVVSGRMGADVFRDVVAAGADMHLAKPVQFEQVALAVQAVHRRTAPQAARKLPAWKLDRRAAALIAPDGAHVALSEADLHVLEALHQAAGQAVSRQDLAQRLGRSADGEGGDGLNATIYRLRQRIRKSTNELMPISAKSRVGYQFQAPLLTV